jgi:hypothetical protein
MKSSCGFVFLWATAALLAAGCARSTPARSDLPPQPTAVVAEREGCRAPDEPGCERCCESSTGVQGCEVRTWNRVGVSDAQLAASGTVPWYNGSAAAQEWPEGCQRCAPCLKREEQQLRALGDRPECDCSRPTGVDPCFQPGSCGCYCRDALRLARSCPSAAPERIRAELARQRE